MCAIKDQGQNSVGSWAPLGRAAWTGDSDRYSAEKSEGSISCCCFKKPPLSLANNSLIPDKQMPEGHHHKFSPM